MKAAGPIRLRNLALGISALVPLCAAGLPGHAAALPSYKKVPVAATPAGKDVLIAGDHAIYDTVNRTVTLEGNVEIDSGGRILLADHVTWNYGTDVVNADGHVSLTDEYGNVAFADHVTLSDRMRNGALTGFAALLGKNGRLAAATARRIDGTVTEAWHVVYSPCKICNQPGQRTPVWQIKADSIVHSEETHRIKFHDATLALLGVPVFYTPFMTEPDPTVRYASGLLTPTIGSSSTIGYFVRLPYYFSLSPSQDATVEPLLTTSGGDVLLGEYRQRWNEGGMWLQSSIGQNPNGGFGREQSQLYSHLFGSGRFPLSAPWQVGFDTQLTSNDTYLKRYSIYQFDRLLNDVFVVGEAGRSRLSATGYFYQGLRATDDNRTFPIPFPLVEYAYVPQHKWLGGQVRVSVNGVVLSRVQGVNDQRVSAELRWRMPLVSDTGQLWTVQLDTRGDFYHTDYLAEPGSHYITRGLPYAALDWRWPFISTGSDGKSIIVEPIAQIVASPYGGNQANIPNEDSLNLEIDENNIFSFDQVPGYDVVETGPRANFGLRAESRFSFGYIEALIGQTLRLKADPIFSAGTGLTGTASDIVGRFSVKFPPYLDLTHRIDFDEGTGTVRRNEVYLTGIYGRSSTQISYIQLAPTLGLPAREEVTAQVNVNFYENWQAFGAIRQDLFTRQTLDNEFGLGYEDDCLGVAVAYRRRYTSDRDLPPSTSVILRFNLKTSQSEIEPFGLFPRDVFSYTRP